MKFTTIIITVMLLTLNACSEPPAPKAKLVRPVKSQQVGFFTDSKSRTFTGTSRTDKVIDLSFRTSGVLSELNLKLGQEVKKGDLLAKLDNVQARLNYENAISARNSAQSQMRTAKSNLDRVRSLYEKGGSSLRDFETAKDSHKTAQQNYNSAVRTVDIQKDQVSFGVLYAPADGVISAVNVEINENVNMGSSIATLNSGSDMEIALGVPESVINFIRKDMPADITFASLAGQSFNGKVLEVSPTIDTNTATYPVTVVVADPSNEVKSGMSANVNFKIAGNNVPEQLVVPANAVGEDANGRFVFLLTQNGENWTANKKTVQIGQLTANGFEILSGIQPGDRIATAGLQTLLDGQTVKTQWILQSFR